MSGSVLEFRIAAGREWASRLLRSTDRCVIAATFLVLLIGYCWGEKINVYNGLGWDGSLYGAQAKDFSQEVAAKSINRYYVQRVLPSAAVHFGLRLFRAGLTDRHVIFGFGILNIACGTFVSFLWCRTADLLKIGPRGKWLGFCALIINFAVAKHASYYPVLTDMPAFALGSVLLYCYLRRQSWGVAVVTVLSAFTWPTLLVVGLILLLFPRTNERANETSSHATRRMNSINILAAGYVALCFTLALVWTVQHVNYPVCGYITPWWWCLPLSIALVAGYAFSVLAGLIDMRAFAAAARALVVSHKLRCLAVVALVAAIKVTQARVAPRPGVSSMSLYLLWLGAKSAAKPGVFLIAHVVYFGPIVILAARLWPSVSRSIRRMGVGLSLAAIAALLQGVDSESRHLIYFLPMLVPFVVLAVEQLTWDTRRVAFFAVLSLVYSKAWFTINKQPLAETGNLFEFPQQYYAMNCGPVMTDQTFLIQAGFTIFAAGLLWAACRRPNGNRKSLEKTRPIANFRRSLSRIASPAQTH